MRKAPVALAILFITLIPVAAAQAQSDTSRGRLWLSAGVGGGWNRVSCAICRGDRTLGPTGYLRIGATIHDGLMLGTEANGWLRARGEDGHEWSGAIGAVAYLYPRPQGPLFVKAGINFLSYHAPEDLSTGSVGVQLGGGYEFHIGDRLLITNYMNLLASSFGSLHTADVRVVDDVSVSMLQIGIGITRR